MSTPKRPPTSKIPNLKKAKPTIPALAELRRHHGGTWNITYVVEGFDEEFLMYAGGKVSRSFAVAATKFHAARALGCSTAHVHIVDIVRG